MLVLILFREYSACCPPSCNDPDNSIIEFSTELALGDKFNINRSPVTQRAICKVHPFGILLAARTDFPLGSRGSIID